MRTAELYDTAARLSRDGVPFALAVVTAVQGSSPRGVGAKMIVLRDGSTIESIGGGALEERVTADALEALSCGSSRSEAYGLRERGERSLGTICGGEVTVFIDVHVSERTLVCVGAGHVGSAVVSAATALDFRVIVLDPRQEMLAPDRFPGAERLICGEPAETARLVDLAESTSVVIVTHSHQHDEAALRSVIQTPAGYVGMIGSAAKVRKIRSRLTEHGVPPEALERVHAPIGLDIGAETPAEIALSIMAEVVAHDRDAGDRPDRREGGGRS